MPNLKDLLLSKLTTPLISADAVDKPSLTRSPMMARAQGFLGGALEANSSPLNLAANLMPFVGKAVKAIPAVAEGASALTRAVPELGTLERMIFDTANGPEMRLPVAQASKLWETGHQPKVGGVLHDVLQRAALKNGMGDALTPGENQLLAQFSSFGRR